VVEAQRRVRKYRTTQRSIDPTFNYRAEQEALSAETEARHSPPAKLMEGKRFWEKFEDGRKTYIRGVMHGNGVVAMAADVDCPLGPGEYDVPSCFGESVVQKQTNWCVNGSYLLRSRSPTLTSHTRIPHTLTSHPFTPHAISHTYAYTYMRPETYSFDHMT
jgi:hypothetical protein